MKTTCCHTKRIYISEQHAVCINPKCCNYLGVSETTSNLSSKHKSLAIIALTLLLMLSLDDYSMENNEYKSASPFIPLEPEIISMEAVECELQTQNVLCDREVLAQIRLESANLSSFLLKRTNNMTGMRYPFLRQTTATGIYLPEKDTIIIGTNLQLKKYYKMKNYAVYNSWKDGITDYKIWQDECFNVSGRYLEYLGKVYAEDSQYIKKIKQVSASKN